MISFPFVFGCIVGVVSGLLLSRFLKSIRCQAGLSQKQLLFTATKEQLLSEHQEFLTQLVQDFDDSANAHVKEFFLVQNNAIMNSAIPRLRYLDSEQNIQAARLLEELDFIQKIPHGSLLYRISNWSGIKSLKSLHQ